MNEIKCLKLENFQSYISTEIFPASKGKLTVVTGASDTGKTAIIRALKWLLYNEPQGAEFTRTGCSMVRVTLTYADGISVVRERTKATNRYKIIRPGAGESGPEVFEGFGGGVPLEVQELTGVRIVKIAEQDLMLNLSEQLDGPFLGQKSISSPGRAKILGKLAGTEEIDVAGAETGKDLYRRGQDEKRLDGEIKDLTEKIQEFVWLEEMGQRINRLDALVGRMKEARETIIRLKALKDRLAEVQGGMDRARRVIARWAGLPQAEAAAAKTAGMVERARTLRRLRDVMKQHDRDARACRQIIDSCDTMLPGLERAAAAIESALTRRGQLHNLQVKLAQAAAGINYCNLTLQKVQGVGCAAEAVKRMDELRARRIKLAEITIKLNSIESQRPQLMQKVIFYEARIPELQEQYNLELAALDICPTCGRPNACPACGSKIGKSKLKEAV